MVLASSRALSMVSASISVSGAIAVLRATAPLDADAECAAAALFASRPTGWSSAGLVVRCLGQLLRPASWRARIA